MSKVFIDPFPIYGWQAHRISCGPLRLVIAPQIGGRIISMRFNGKEMIYLNRELAGQVNDFTAITDIAAHKNEFGFRIYGGDKTWVAPQSAWASGIPPLELDAAPYTFTLEDKKVTMVSPICRETSLQVTRQVMLDEEGVVHLREEFKNMSADQTVSRGIWNVTQIPRPCDIFVPAAKNAFRSYHTEDKTLPEVKDIFRNEEGWVEVHCVNNTLFKIGGIPSDGQVIIKVPMHHRKEVVWLKTFKLENFVKYAHRSIVEVFNSDKANYAEVEVHGPLMDLQPGQSCALEQQWRFREI